MTQISVTRALAKISHLDDKITRETAKLDVIRVTKGDGENKTFVDNNQKIEEFEKDAVSSLQSIKDMLLLRSRLKAAVNKSNSITVVKIGNREMTVAEAIQEKSQIASTEYLISILKRQSTTADERFKRESALYEQKIDQALAVYGGRDKAPSEEGIAVITKPLRDKQLPGVSDAIKVNATIKELQDSVDEFKLEVDFVLSESNASTLVDVE